MASFSIVGPIEVPLVTKPGGRYIDKPSLRGFWEEAGCEDGVGCYVFTMRHGRGSKPYYAGRTTNSFGNECFTPHKLTKYHEALVHVKSGKPVMFFAVLATTRGRRNDSAIVALEGRLIGMVMQRNPDLRNVSATMDQDIEVEGVMGSGKGRPSAAASAFKEMMGL